MLSPVASISKKAIGFFGFNSMVKVLNKTGEVRLPGFNDFYI